MSKARNLSDFISDPTISTTEIADLAVTHAKLHGTMDLSSKTVTLPTLSTLNTTGSVGIGTDSPAVALEIIGTTTSGIRIKNNALHSNGFNIYVDSSTDTAVLNNPFSGPMLF